MNIEPTYVSLKQAQWLKEKGFNIPCLYYYDQGKLTEPYLENGSSTDVEFRVDLSDLLEHFSKHSKRISAPEQWQVVEWLFIKHKIYIHTTPIGNENDPIDENCKWSVSIYKDKLYNLKWGSKVTPNVDYFKSKQEAYSAAFDYILNNKII